VDGSAFVSWYEDDKFWVDFYPAMYHEGRWEVAVEEVKQISGLLQLAPGDRVLDVCCGPGRHAICLARAGFEMMGVDHTATYLDIGRQRAEDERLEVDFILDDVRQFRREAGFDAALCMYTSLGYFDDPDEDRVLLENICHSLKPGGRLIVDLSGKEVLAHLFRAENRTVLADGSTFLEERSIVGDWERVNNRWVLDREDGRVERRFSVRIYSGEDLKGMMLAAGFETVDLYGTLDGTPYDHSARRLVAVGLRRP
jgi:SAM-dependent methyltransferase